MTDLKEQFPLGTKVVPHSKHKYNDLNNSVVWRKAQKKGQVYLFINGYEGNDLILGDVYDIEYGGDYFLPTDVTLYTDAPNYQIY